MFISLDIGGSGTEVELISPSFETIDKWRVNITRYGDLGRLVRSLPKPPDAASVAGVWLEAEREAAARVLGCPVFPDGVAALAGAHGGRPGIVVIAGTGSGAYGGDPRGKVERVGGWGPLLGDDGGGFWLGREALRAALRAVDGLGEDTRLVELLGDEPRALIGRLTVEEVASFAPKVIDMGDPIADRIVQEGARRLALMAGALARRTGLTSVSWWGGVFGSEKYLNLFKDFICEMGLAPRPPLHSPAWGALWLARNG